MGRYKIFLIFFLLFLVGCSTKEEVILKATPSKAPAKLAILPINNYTNDVAGGFVFREILYKNFKTYSGIKKYIIQDIEKTDKLLNDAGITDGGQLKFMRPIEICEILGVDGLLYTDLKELDLNTYPYYHLRSVMGVFYLYNFEKLVWASPIRAGIKYVGVSSAINTIDGAVSGDTDKMQSGITQAGIDMAIHLGVKYATIVAYDHELAPEMFLVSKTLIHDLPQGSSSDEEYLKEVDKEIKYLREKVSRKESIIDDEMYEPEKESVPVKENIILLLN